jgi:Ras-related GTP-binding protein A/B
MSYLEDSMKKDEKPEDFTSKSEKKILFTGMSQVGKSSIIQSVFEGRNPEETKNIPATIGFVRQRIDYSGISLYVVDLGGQTTYLEESFSLLRETMFSNLAILLFVVDAAIPDDFETAKMYFQRSLRNVEEYSKEAKIVVLAHKMDLIAEGEKESIVNTISNVFEIDDLENVEIYPTSIYEQSIFEAIERILA